MDADKQSEKDWQKWIRALERAGRGMGLAAYDIQVLAGEMIANRLRVHLLAGVEPELSPMTVALKGGRQPPLAALARHVVVKKPKERPKPGGKPSSFHPVEVTFDEPWQEIAFNLEHGALIYPSPKIRRALFFQARQQGWVPQSGTGSSQGVDDEGTEKASVWFLPPRPFAHILTSPESEQELLEAARQIFNGEITKVERMNVKPKFEEASEDDKPEFVNFDDVESVLGSNPWDSMGGGDEDDSPWDED